MAGLTKNPDEPSLTFMRPQFCLRTLMLSVTLCGVLFALMSALGGLWSIMIVLFLSLVVAHIFGNALGTQLRDANQRQPRPADRAEPYDAASPPVPTAQRLREHTGISRKLLVFAALCALVGGTLGGCGLVFMLGEQASVAAIGLGIASSAVLGGFFGFLLSSFCVVFSRALGEALGDPTRPKSVAPHASHDGG
jgi:hypothetical protein